MKRLIKAIPAFAIMILFLTGCCEQLCTPHLIPDCVTTLEYNPVCGCDNNTYGNASQARCNSIFIYRPGACD